MYTTTYCSAFPGPVTTFSPSKGGLCSLAQVGSLDMSIGFIFGGVPVYVTLPSIVPAGAGPTLATATVKANRTGSRTYLACITTLLRGCITDEKSRALRHLLPNWFEGVRMALQPCLKGGQLRRFEGYLQGAQEVHQIPSLFGFDVVRKRGHGRSVKPRHKNTVEILVGRAALEPLARREIVRPNRISLGVGKCQGGGAIPAAFGSMALPALYFVKQLPPMQNALDGRRGFWRNGDRCAGLLGLPSR